MTIADQMLAALLVYGLPVLFLIVLIASIGVPLPVTLMLVAAGSFAKQGEMKLAFIIAVASSAAILGDNISYGLCRWGGRRLVDRITGKIGGASKIEKAEALSKKWGGAGVFLSRWLITELGPWLNVTSGLTGYPWPRFLLWDVLGELLWVALYVTLGYVFSDRVQYLVEILGNLAWVILGVLISIILGVKVFRYFKPKPATVAATPG